MLQWNILKKFLEKIWIRSNIKLPMNTNNFMIIHVDDEDKFLYVEVPKAGCSTIKYELFFKRRFGEMYPRDSMHHILGYKFTETLDLYRKYFKFTVVRDPFTRFMSVYFERIFDRKDPTVCDSLGITDLGDEIFSDVNKFLSHMTRDILNRDHHTALQSYLLRNNLDQLDYIGQLENIKDVEDNLSEVLDEEITFAWLNKGSRKDHYPIDVDMQRFNNIFSEDYEFLKDYYKPFQK